MYFVICNTAFHAFLLRISCGASGYISPVEWTNSLQRCIHFISQEQAELTINFLVNVMGHGQQKDFYIVKLG